MRNPQRRFKSTEASKINNTNRVRRNQENYEENTGKGKYSDTIKGTKKKRIKMIKGTIRMKKKKQKNREIKHYE